MARQLHSCASRWRIVVERQSIDCIEDGRRNTTFPWDQELAPPEKEGGRMGESEPIGWSRTSRIKCVEVFSRTVVSWLVPCNCDCFLYLSLLSFLFYCRCCAFSPPQLSHSLSLFLSLPLSISLAAFDASCITRRQYSPWQFLAKIVRPCLSFGPGCHRCHSRHCKQTNAGGCPK